MVVSRNETTRESDKCPAGLSATDRRLSDVAQSHEPLGELPQKLYRMRDLKKLRRAPGLSASRAGYERIDKGLKPGGLILCSVR